MPETPGIDVSTIQKAEIDTDSAESRLHRAQNQYKFEQEKLPSTYGKSFRERYFAIRGGLFEGFDNVSGEDVHGLIAKNELVSDKRPQVHDEFVPDNASAKDVMPHYEQQVDALYGQIQQMPDGEEKEAAAMRFVSAMFVEGIMIHPARDGNGQTFKTLVESYMQDLVPSKRESFVPIKYAHGPGHSEEYEMAIKFMGGGIIAREDDLTAGAVPSISPRNEKDALVLKAIDAMREITQKDLKDDESYQKYTLDQTQQIQKVAQQYAEKLGIPEFAKLDIRYERKGLFRKGPVPGSARREFQKQCYDYLKSQGYDQKKIDVTVFGGPGEKIDRASFAIEQLIGTEEGRKVIGDYVLTGKSQIPDDKSLAGVLYDKAIRNMERQKENIIKLIESKEAHDKRHQEMLAPKV